MRDNNLVILNITIQSYQTVEAGGGMWGGDNLSSYLKSKYIPRLTTTLTNFVIVLISKPFHELGTAQPQLFSIFFTTQMLR